jgi:hypothetical protein
VSFHAVFVELFLPVHAGEYGTLSQLATGKLAIPTARGGQAG